MAQLSIPIPDRMAHLPRDRRGLPIPVTVHRDEHGKPHFQINEEAHRQRVIAEDRCPICGGKLLRGRWLVGGPASAFHAHGAYIDPPMHTECLHFAMKVCPYLAAPSYAKLLGKKTLAPHAQNDVVETDEGMLDERPGVFVAVMATGQRLIRGEMDGTGGGIAMVRGMELVRYVKPRQPYSRVEYWRHGVQISEAEAAPFIAASLAAADAHEAEHA